MWLQRPPLGTKLNYSHPIVNTLLGLWIFNEGGGNKTYDSSPNNVTGAIAGTTAWTLTEKGDGLYFPDTSGAIVTTRNYNITYPYSFTAGFKLLGNYASNGYQGIVTQVTGNTSGSRLYLDNNDHLVYEQYVDGASKKVTLDTIIVVGKTYLVTCQYTGASLEFYIDGCFVKKTDYVGVVSGGTGNLILGESYVTGNTLYGIINYFMLNNRALTRNEISNLYASPYQIFSSNFKYNWVGLGVGPSAFTQAVAGGLIASAEIVNKIYPHLSGGMTTSGLKLSRTYKTLTGGLTDSGAELRRTLKILSGGLTKSGALSSLKAFFISIAGALTSSGDILKKTGKGIVAGLTTSGNKVISVLKNITGNLTSSGVLSSLKAFFISIAGGLTASAIIIKRVNYNIIGAITSTGQEIRAISKNILSGLASSGLMTYTTTAIQVFYQTITGGLMASGEMVKTWSQVLYKLFYIMKK